MKYPGIPAQSRSPVIAQVQQQKIIHLLTENVELLNGTRSPTIDPLPSTATLAQVIAKVNEIVDRLTNDGQ